MKLFNRTPKPEPRISTTRETKIVLVDGTLQVYEGFSHYDYYGALCLMEDSGGRHITFAPGTWRWAETTQENTTS